MKKKGKVITNLLFTINCTFDNAGYFRVGFLVRLSYVELLLILIGLDRHNGYG